MKNKGATTLIMQYRSVASTLIMLIGLILIYYQLFILLFKLCYKLLFYYYYYYVCCHDMMLLQRVCCNNVFFGLLINIHIEAGITSQRIQEYFIKDSAYIEYTVLPTVIIMPCGNNCKYFFFIFDIFFFTGHQLKGCQKSMDVKSICIYYMCWLQEEVVGSRYEFL